ncbi:MAG: glycosyltransferase family 2 protein [Solirubrobacteraceae bacterium]
MSSDEVVVCIPTYNRSVTLDRAVRSVLAQDHASLTVLISDDASTDDTAAVCRRLADGDPRVVVRRHERNLGLTANFNWVMQTALDRSRARDRAYFMFLPDDDWIEPDYIGRCVEKLANDRGYSLVAGRMCGHDGERSSWYAPDVNLEADDPLRRIAAFCRGVVPSGLLSGVMPIEIAARLPPQRNVVGNDWLLLTSVVYLGKVATLPGTAVHCSADGVSSSLRDLTTTLGVSRYQATKPLLTVGLFLISECMRRSPVFRCLPIGSRLQVLAVALTGFLLRRALPLARRGADRLTRGLSVR